MASAFTSFTQFPPSTTTPPTGPLARAKDNPMNMSAFSSPAPSGSFRDDAVAQWADRRRRTVLNRRKRNVVLAALALAGTVFSATTAASLLTSEAATPPAQTAACVAAGQRLAPWFRA